MQTGVDFNQEGTVDADYFRLLYDYGYWARDRLLKAADGMTEAEYAAPNNLTYGSYMFDEIVTIRIVVTLRQIDPSSVVVACNAWMVEDANDPVFADSHPVRQLRKWPYEQLMKDIRTQLGE